jgi:hypothetical protein
MNTEKAGRMREYKQISTKSFQHSQHKKMLKTFFAIIPKKEKCNYAGFKK